MTIRDPKNYIFVLSDMHECAFGVHGFSNCGGNCLLRIWMKMFAFLVFRVCVCSISWQAHQEIYSSQQYRAAGFKFFWPISHSLWVEFIPSHYCQNLRKSFHCGWFPFAVGRWYCCYWRKLKLTWKNKILQGRDLKPLVDSLNQW